MRTEGVCFNPRTHEGCDSFCTESFKATIVSIHAPTRGATFFRVRLCRLYHVSIHAPTRGATPARYISAPKMQFQSTHPRGVRQNCKIMYQIAKCFNPRTHEGCDQVVVLLALVILKFQSTHPRGVRQINKRM